MVNSCGDRRVEKVIAEGGSRSFLVTGFPGNLEGVLRLSDAPRRLFFRGELETLKNPSISIVGTRRLTNYGKAAVRELLTLPGVGLNYVSGLALGIDAQVHKIALDNRIPTIAVVAGSLTQGYPRANQALYNSIVKQGLILAEFPESKPFFKGMYPMRNRLIAAVSPLTVVIEAGTKSGALITARHALDLGHEVAAVPGSIFSEQSKGCNELIAQGAHAISSKGDLITLINSIYSMNYQINGKLDVSSTLDFVKGLPDIVKYAEGFDVKTAAKLSKKEVPEVLLLLTRLEMEGILQRNFSGKYILKK